MLRREKGNECPPGVCLDFWRGGKCTPPLSSSTCPARHIPKPTKPGICFSFWINGTCTRGRHCTFKHSSSSESKAKSKSTSSLQQTTLPSSSAAKPLPKFAIFFRFNRPFRNQHDMRRFVMSALADRDVHDVVLRLGDSPVGLEYLRHILVSPFTIKAGNHAQKFSFQRIVVPLCMFLTQATVSQSPHRKAMAQVYQLLFDEKLFFPRIISCCEHMMMAGLDRDGVSLVPDTIADEVYVFQPRDACRDIFLPLARLYSMVASRVTDANADAAYRKLYSRIEKISQSFSRPNQEIEKTLCMIEMILQHAEKNQAAAADARREAALCREEQFVNLGLDLIQDGAPSITGPGIFRREGPRHDNDFDDFRQIHIVPTDDEIRSTISPYLPLMSTGSQHVAHPVDRHLDKQFRLLREDMLASIRRGIQSFLGQDMLSQLGPSKSIWRCNGDTLFVFRNISFCGITTQLHSGTDVVIEFDQPSDVGHNTSAQKVKKYWESGPGARLLQYGSLACLIVCGSKAGAAGEEDVMIGTISTRDVKWLSNTQDRARVGIDLINTSSLGKIFNYMKTDPSLQAESVLLQLKGHFFLGYHPILKSLQDHDMTSIPFAEAIIPGAGDSNSGHDLPSYLEGQHISLDLSTSITKNGISDQERAILRNVAPAQLLTTLHQMSDQLDLDDTQIDAFALAMTHKVALIQGPPGTGKTYVGVRIVRALLENSSGPSSQIANPAQQILPGFNHDEGLSKAALDPILCICYTNHALDSFLCSLLQNGVSLESMVRIGSRSKSEVLQERSLNKLVGRSKTREEYGRWKDLQRKATTIEEKIGELNRICTASVVKDIDLFEWIKEEDYEFYECISKPLDDGFERVGGDVAALSSWLKGHSFEGVVPDEISTPSVGRNPSDLLSYHVSDAWEWSLEERHSVGDTLRLRCKEESLELLEGLIAEMAILSEQRLQISEACQLRILQKSKVIGITTSGAAMHQTLLNSLGVRVIMCEEAGEVLESHVLVCLSSATEHLILIGDHLQLRPKVAEHSLSVFSGLGFDLNQSLFERMVSMPETSNICTLLTQRRMRPEISDLLRANLYPSLLDGDNVFRHPPLSGFSESVWFFDHDWKEKSGNNQSAINEQEAHLVLALTKYAMRHGYTGERLAIITPYVGQLLVLKQLFSKSRMTLYISDADIEDLEATGVVINEEARNVTIKDSVRLATVDNFQGEEADFVIVSTVRCNAKSRTGFLKEDNRVNVMLSRARHGMVILGSKETIFGSKNGPKLFRAIVQQLCESSQVDDCIRLKCKSHGTVTVVRSSVDVPDDGGCSEICGARKQCGHACMRRCHPDDINHVETNCLEPCTRVLPCRHPCQKICGAPCDSCPERVERTLPCGHSRIFRCDDGSWIEYCCQVLFTRNLLCGHEAQVKCCDLASVKSPERTFSCTERCNQALSCLHLCSAKCGECCQLTFETTGDLLDERNLVRLEHHQPCDQPCERNLFCGHECNATPCHDANQCPPCTKPCLIGCEHSVCKSQCRVSCSMCAHPCTWRCTCEANIEPCTLSCGSPCNRLPCNTRCAKELTCGHRCPSVCGEACPVAEYCVECGTKQDEIADYMMYEKLCEVDVDRNPIVVLSCGHILTIESLDGICGMDNVYGRGDDGSSEDPWTWTLFKPIDRIQIPRPKCPECRVPVTKVRRCSRILNLISLQTCQRKYLATIRGFVSAVLKKLETFEKRGITDEKGLKKVLRQSSTLETKIESFWSENPYMRLYEIDILLSPGGNIEPLKSSLQPLILLEKAQFEYISFVIVCSISLVDQVAQKKHGKDKKKSASGPASGLKISAPDDELMNEKFGTILDLLTKAEFVFDSARKHCEESQSRSSMEDNFRGRCRLYLKCLDGMYEKKDAREMCMDLFDRLCMATKDLKEYFPLDSILLPLVEKSIARWEERLNSNTPFYKEVSAEEKLEIFRAMQREVGDGVGSFGGHWFECPNGHTYTIGECGGAMETSLCPECGSVVGGSNHLLDSGNRVSRQFLQDIGRNE